MHGSRRHLRKCAVNGLQIVSEYGIPTIFLTVTCNANWPELIAALSPGQTAFDNPAISTLVFKKRLEALLYNIRHGKYFGCKRIAVCEELYKKVFSDIECFTPFFFSLDEKNLVYWLFNR